MPFTFSISPAERVAFVEASGCVDLRAAMEAMGNVRKDPRFDPDYGVLVDAREMEYTPTAGEIGVLAWALGHEKINYRSKVAVIRPTSGRQAGREVYSRLAATTGVALGLFSDRKSALLWVGRR